MINVHKKSELNVINLRFASVRVRDINDIVYLLSRYNSIGYKTFKNKISRHIVINTI